MGFYRLAWRIARPFLQRNQRLADGWNQRLLRPPLPRAELWIQAASAGEAYLAGEIIRTLDPLAARRVLITTNTRQGMDILTVSRGDDTVSRPGLEMTVRYFPFDHPRLMTSAVAAVRPRLVCLLETELWPGLLAACRTMQTPVVIVNGRINLSSLTRYRLWPGLWQALSPRRILATSRQDAGRFGCLFPDTPVRTMPNIKFDLWMRQIDTRPADALAPLFASSRPLAVFGSIRQEEESRVQKMISRIHGHRPETVIAVFPRHMARLSHWTRYLTDTKLPGCLRSKLTGPVPPGQIVLWDTFGELRDAYGLATTAFVGGSLADLGGQNFLEPLGCGVVPVIGPSWHNFAWVGEEIFSAKLVCRATGWETAADNMIAALTRPFSRPEVLARVRRYAGDHAGGTRQSCRMIETYLAAGKK